MEERSYIFEMLMDSIILLFTFFVQPFVVLVYWITYDESRILNSYGIASNVVILYLLSAITIATFTSLNVILIFHLLESYVEVDFQKITESLLKRFEDREVFWKANDEDINMGISPELRGADHYCLSWQFFLLLTVYIGSMILVMLGISILMNIDYNPLKDAVNLISIIFWYCFVKTLIWCIQTLGYKLNIDNWADRDSKNNKFNTIISYKENPPHSDTPTNQGLLINSSENELFSDFKRPPKLASKRTIQVASEKVSSFMSEDPSQEPFLQSESESLLTNEPLDEDNVRIKI